MADTVFVNKQTQILAPWAQDVNNYVYRNTVMPEQFGAIGDGTTNDTAAFADAVATGLRVIGYPGSTYKITSPISVVTAGQTIDGLMGACTIVTNGSNVFHVNASNVTVRGWVAVSSATGTTADAFVYAVNVDGVKVEYNRLTRMFTEVRASSHANLNDIRIRDNWIDGDWTDDSIGHNVLDLYGINDLWITGNHFSVVGPYRFIKISSSLPDSDHVLTTEMSQRVNIQGNHFLGSLSNTNNVIDVYCGTKELLATDNVVNMTGSINSWISAKPGITGAGQPESATTTKQIVSNNVATLSGSVINGFVSLHSSWGQPWEDSSILQMAQICDNIIHHDQASTSATIDVRGFNHVLVQGNVAQKVAVNFSRFISAYNNQIAIVGHNQTNYGTIEVSGNSTSASGVAYSKSPEIVNIHNSALRDFVGSAAIYVHDCAGLLKLKLHDNYIGNSADSGSIGAAIRLEHNTLDTMCVHDNLLAMNNAAKAYIQFVTTTPTYRIEHGNSWNQTSATFNPGDLVDGAGVTSSAISLKGAAFGAAVTVAAPYDLQGMTVTGYVSAADNVKIRVQNESAGELNVGSGTWNVAVSWG